MKKLGSESVPNSADFRLMSSRALNGLAEYEEVNLFYVAWSLLWDINQQMFTINVGNVLQGKVSTLSKDGEFCD